MRDHTGQKIQLVFESQLSNWVHHYSQALILFSVISTLRLYDLRERFKAAIRPLKFYITSELDIYCLQFLL